MVDNFHISDFSKPIYLHHNFEKFWEIKLDPINYKTGVRCGKLLSNGREDPISIQTLEKSNASWGEAVLYCEKHVKMKLSKGYDFLEKTNHQVPSANFSMTPPPHGNLDLLSPDTSRSNGFDGNSPNASKRRPADVLPRDDLKQTKKNASLEEDSLENVLKSLEERDKFESEQKSLGDYTQKAYRVENLAESEKKQLTSKAESLELICDIGDGKVLVAGFQKKIDLFVEFLKKFLAGRKKPEENQDQKKEIPLSAQAIKAASYIEQKGIDLGLLCEVREKSVFAVGKADKIAELESYIKEKDREIPKSPTKAEEVKKEIPLTPLLKTRKAELEKKADQLRIFCEFSDTKLIVLGTQDSIMDFMGYILELKDAPPKEKPKDDPGEYTQKEIKMTKAITNNMPELKRRAEALELILDIENDKFLVAGFEKNINELKKFIEEKEKDKPKEVEIPRSPTSNKPVGDYVQKEISISTFHRGKQEEIEKKAKEMDIIIDFGYDVILLSGPMSSIGMFIAFLYEVESSAKKALYPKYWDFHEVNAFSMAEINRNTPEFNEVDRLFLQTMQGHNILHLHRIQNKYLMDHYVTNVQKRLELRPKDLNRMLLFHGTRLTAPETIYKNFDTGFDLQYAAHGAYGKGLYFAVGANYSHGGFVHRTKKGTFQLLIADVFVGKAKVSGGGNFIKAPEGYDSISANGRFYIIYNNFHSYPLYLLEYR